LIRHFLQIATDKDALILDSFAGSGTTGHAVLAQNAADDGNRHFILVEMDDNICRNITAQRLTKVSQGYNDFPALGVGFRYCELGEPLFDERGNIRATVSFADLARHVYFTETGEPLPATKETKSPLLGVHNGTAVYLLYNGILKDRTKKGGNVLTTNILAALPGHEGNKVIYGTACRIDAERLRREGIVFKQLPYKLKVGVL
jgi:site-specific DNA-methyltransferase (adenine-specific)/adenine-specific DNA-methyltransferase